MKYNQKSQSFVKRAWQKCYHGLVKRHYHYFTSPLRVLPDFFVIGVVRSGTTSLFHYLGQHQCIRTAAYDELGFFDDNFHLGMNWYRSLFPTSFIKKKIENKYGKFLTFDDTPFYIYNPLVAERIHQLFPQTKLIVNLRNPIDRAYSNYDIALTKNEKRTFEEVIDHEIQYIDRVKDKLDDKAFLVNEFYELILARGFYSSQLKFWFNKFSKNQFLFISSEEFAHNTNKTLEEIFKFLELPSVEIKDLTKQNKREYPKMKEITRDKLIDYFKPHNEELFRMLGRRFEWDE